MFCIGLGYGDVRSLSYASKNSFTVVVKNFKQASIQEHKETDASLGEELAVRLSPFLEKNSLAMRGGGRGKAHNISS